ncbi:ATP synthase d subunit [Mrakia frigida]|uniref:F1F0 ATP synthase subunit d n=1 Tax=Mrakia frigida TaxID=29902 RepID=UPI003FCC000A
MASKVTKAAVVVDFARIQATYGLGKESLSALATFRKRATDAAVQNSLLSEANSQGKVDFAHYRSILKNQAVIDEIEKSISTFKPVAQDITADLKALAAFEAKAVVLSEATCVKIEESVVDLKQDLQNIVECRPIEDLTVNEVIEAIPELRDTLEIMAYNTRWDWPGHKEKFGTMSIL